MARTADQWQGLADKQRNRYVAAGKSGRLTGRAGLTPTQVRNYYVKGGDLRAARGAHPTAYVHPIAKPSRPPAAAVKAAQEGHATEKQLKSLKTWQQKKAPKWLQDPALSEDTASILSRVNLQPRNWKAARIYYQKDGTVWLYVDSKRGGPTRKVLLPDGSSSDEVVTLVARSNAGVTGEGEAPEPAAGTDVQKYGYRTTTQAA